MQKQKPAFNQPWEQGKSTSRYPKGYIAIIKNKSSWDHRDNKAKSSYNSPPANASQSQTQTQTQTQASKKNTCHQRSHSGGNFATGVNTIKVAKKDKDKAKNLSYIKYYTYKQKVYYINKCPEKPKNQWQFQQPPRQ